MFTGHVPQGTGFKKIGEVTPEFAYLDEIVERMIQHSPDRRPGTIDEIKQMLIARKNEFVSRQKLDQLRQTVVPSTAIVDELVANPPSVRSVDVIGNTLMIGLSRPVTPGWIRAFNTLGGYSSLPGTQPANWSFNGTVASVCPPQQVLDSYAQQVVNHFKQYVEGANAGYLRSLEREARLREDAEKSALRQRIVEEERRQRILQNLKI